MKFKRLPLLLAALSATALPSLAQQTASHTYTTVDAYGNVKTETVHTPLANASSPVAQIAQQGVLGRNTTSSNVTYGRTYPPVQNDYYRNDYYQNDGYQDGYYPPTVPVPVPVYTNPYPAPYGYGYGYPAVNNNYYIPSQPYNMQIGPTRNGSAPWVTSIPLGTTYVGGGGLPYCPPTYGGTYYNGVGVGSIITNSTSSKSSISVGNRGVKGSIGSLNNSVSTVILPGYRDYVSSNESQRRRRR
jgi:hypothetical protein